jgi:predicted dehydrogenase
LRPEASLVPDDAHLKVAKEWLTRSTLILIEKPYNRDLDEAIEFEAELRSVTERKGKDAPATCVWAFDHYLAKIAEYVFNRERHNLFERIGRLAKVEFGILEQGPVEPWRAESLRAGMIYDLFSHVLAMLSEELDLASFRRNGIRRIAVARHEGLESPGDTFASFDFDLDDHRGQPIAVSGAVGKGVGERDDKFLAFIGESGFIKCDLSPGGTKRVRIKERGWEEGPIYDINTGHPEFIKALLEGQYIERPIGGLTGDTAVQILQIMNKIRAKIPPMIGSYKVGESVNEIAVHSTQLRF